jgi:hypothetical protein
MIFATSRRAICRTACRAPARRGADLDLERRQALEHLGAVKVDLAADLFDELLFRDGKGEIGEFAEGIADDVSRRLAGADLEHDIGLAIGVTHAGLLILALLETAARARKPVSRS